MSKASNKMRSASIFTSLHHHKIAFQIRFNIEVSPELLTNCSRYDCNTEVTPRRVTKSLGIWLREGVPGGKRAITERAIYCNTNVKEGNTCGYGNFRGQPH